MRFLWLVLLLATPAAAEVPLRPPSRFVFDPPQGLIVYQASPLEIDRLCRGMMPDPKPANVHACQYTAESGECVVMLPTRRTHKATRDQLYRHEIAHCNGWTH